jgi:hypothetical protein
MIERNVDLVFDDAGTTLRVETHGIGAVPATDEDVPEPFVVRYEDVVRVVLETTTRSNGAPAQWLYFEQKPTVSPQRLLFVTGGSMSAQITAKIRESFGARVAEPRYSPIGGIDSIGLSKAALKCKYSRLEAAIPEVRPDRALVFVVCPRITDNPRTEIGGAVVRLMIDGREAAANREGTFAYVYVQPGERTIASQTDQSKPAPPHPGEIWAPPGMRDLFAYGTQMMLEAGHAYYFSQDAAHGWLFMRSKETAVYESTGAFVLTRNCPKKRPKCSCYAPACRCDMTVNPPEPPGGAAK